MIGNKLPQNLLSGLALGIGVGAIMLALFYGQYQWLANELVSSSATEHDSCAAREFRAPNARAIARHGGSSGGGN